MMDWLAETYVDALNVIHYMHDKYAYERLEMALHDYPVHRTHGLRHRRPVGRRRQPVGDQARPGAVGPRRDRPGRRLPRSRASFPAYGNNDDRADAIAGRAGASRFMAKVRRHPTYRDAEHTQSVLTITSNVVYGKHTGNTPDGRRAGEPFAPGRQPDERPRPARHGRRRAVGGQAAVRAGPRRHLADHDGHPGRPRAAPARSGSATWSACSTATSTPAAST